MLLVCGCLTLIVGCRGGAQTKQVDSQIEQQAKAAVEAYAEGKDDVAILRYRRALKRAWALDDPVEIGSNAYNLAACLASVGWYEAARDCLAESRAELHRAGHSEADAWLLEAKIARSQGLTEEAYVITEGLKETLPRPKLIQHASFEKHDEPCCEEESIDDDRHPLIERLRKRKHEGHDRPHAEKRQEIRASTVALHLFRAQLACDARDLDTAEQELATAERAARHLKDDEVPRAEMLQVRARILLLSMQPAAAALRLDAEADLLREAGHYREIPLALTSAAEAYLMAGDLVAASERFHRVARMLYGRDDLIAAIHFIDRAVALADATEDGDLQARLALVFHEVDSAWEASRQRQAERRRQPEVQTPPAEEVAVPPADAESPSTLYVPEEASPPPPDPQEEVYVWLDTSACLARPWPVVMCGRLQRPPGNVQPLLHGPFGLSTDEEAAVEEAILESEESDASHLRRRTSQSAPDAATQSDQPPTSDSLEALRQQLARPRYDAARVAEAPGDSPATSRRLAK